jgi:hypothetical protein
MSEIEKRDSARRKAQNHFAASEQRDSAIKQEIERDRAAVAAKTAKLRTLRLQKEAAEADAKAAEPAPKTRKTATSRKTVS